MDIAIIYMNTNVGEMPLDIFSDYVSDILGEEWNWEYLAFAMNGCEGNYYENTWGYGRGVGQGSGDGSTYNYGNGLTEGYIVYNFDSFDLASGSSTCLQTGSGYKDIVPGKPYTGHG
jgi:hypothetical protein